MNRHPQYERASAKSCNIRACARTHMPFHPMNNMDIQKRTMPLSLSALWLCDTTVEYCLCLRSTNQPNLAIVAAIDQTQAIAFLSVYVGCAPRVPLLAPRVDETQELS